MNIDDTIQEIRDFLNKNAITRQKLSRIAGIEHTLLLKVFDDDWNPTLKTLRAICNAIRAYRLGTE